MMQQHANRSIRRGTALLTAIALLLVGAASAWAALVGSAQIANNSIRSIDIRNGAVAGIDVQDGSVRSVDLHNGTIGPADMGAMPYARAGLNGGVPVADTPNGSAMVLFDNEVADTSSMYDPATGRMTAPRSGTYHVEANLLFDNANPPGSTRAFIYVSDFGVAGGFGSMVVGAAEASASVSMDIELDAGDTVYIGAGQDSGGADQLVQGFSWFSMRWVGPHPG